ncbi:MAG: zinc metallopeptidase [Enterococcus sp.]|nr:zinc metallopeptidase [Enterococcus sp.]
MIFFPNSQYLLLCLITLVIGLATSGWCKSRLSKFRKRASSNGLTGAAVASRMLDNYGVVGVEIRQGGNDQDFFNPKDNSISLSPDVFHGTSITAQAVACHEVGHACQYAQSYGMIKVRNSLVPTVNAVSNVWPFLIIVGIILHITGLIWIAVALYAIAVLFHLVTLPVEFNASKRAVKFLKETSLLNSGEISGSCAVLRSCALTYVSAALISILNLLYYLSFLTNDDR